MDNGMGTESSRLVRQVFTELEDAVLNADRVSDCKAELRDIQSRKEGHIKRERKIRDEIRSVLDSYAGEEGFEFFKMYYDNIMEHSSSSLDDYENMLSQHMDKEITAKEDEMESYRAKSIRSLEAFFSWDQIEAIESEISLHYVEGGYESRYRCVCPRELEYEFMLNASEVEFLKSRLEGSTLLKGLKLPVRFAKTWVSREPAVDFERLDTYYLTQASLSDSNLFVTFRDDETGSEFKFHSSMSEGTIFLEIDYKDTLQSVSLTSQPALNANLNRDSVNDMLTQIKTALVYLKDHKLRLSSLHLRDVDVIGSMKITDLFYTILEILSPRISAEIARVISDTGTRGPADEKPLNREYIASRLALLGDRSQTVSSLLGITGFMDSMAKDQ